MEVLGYFGNVSEIREILLFKKFQMLRAVSISSACNELVPYIILPLSN